MTAEPSSEAVAAVANVAGVVAQFADLDGHHAAVIAALTNKLETASYFDEGGSHGWFQFGHAGMYFKIHGLYENAMSTGEFHEGEFLDYEEKFCRVQRLAYSEVDIPPLGHQVVISDIPFGAHFATKFTGQSWKSIAEVVVRLVDDKRICTLSASQTR